jgi:hypothetical protein
LDVEGESMNGPYQFDRFVECEKFLKN